MPDRLVANYAPTVIEASSRFGGEKPPGPPLQPPGGGGTFDGMLEARVARLEADVAHIKSDITEMKGVIKDAGKDLSDLKVGHATVVERIGNLPTKGYIGWWISGGLAITVAVLTIMSRLGWLVATTPK
jgi:hypothetical protein